MRHQPLLTALLVGIAIGCSEPDSKRPSADMSAATRDAATLEGPDVSGSKKDAAVDASIDPDVPPEPPYCATASSEGFFPDCTACDAEELDCDTIDSPNASGKACGCSGGCPCGLRCGSYEIGPGVTVSGICVR